MQNSRSHHGNGSDPDIDALLRSTVLQTPLPDSFQHAVWRRIEAAGEESVSNHIRRFASALLGSFAMPLPAAGAVTLMVAAGLWLGAREADARGKADYVISVSPFAESHQQDSDE